MGIVMGLMLSIYAPLVLVVPVVSIMAVMVLLALCMQHNLTVAREVAFVRTACSIDAGAQATKRSTALLWAIAMLYGELAIGGAVATLSWVLVFFLFFGTFS